MPTYGQEIHWTDWDGNRTCVRVDGCDTPETALREAIDFARQLGWTRPRWWQWWRWHDTRPHLLPSGD